MKRRLYARMCALSLAMTILTAVLLLSTVYPFFQDRMHDEMRAETRTLAIGLAQAQNESAYLSALRGTFARVTLLNADGAVLFDTDADAASMENHQDRPEVANALDAVKRR